MSRSSLWVMNKKFHGKEIKEYGNSWLFAPVAWDILLNKYLPVCGPKRYLLSASMFDRNIDQELNKKINNSPDQADRVLWEMSNQQIFFSKDREFIATCIEGFLANNAVYYPDKLGEHIFARYSVVAADIRQINGDKHLYFIQKNTSCDDGVEYWFQGKYGNGRAFNKLEDRVTEFVFIENNTIDHFVSNTDFFRIGGND